VVKNFRQKFCFRRTVKQAVINDKYIFSVLTSQRLNKAINNLCGKQKDKTLSVVFCVIEETIDCIFTESFLKNLCFSLHEHVSVRENETEQITEYVHYRDFLHFSDAVLEKCLLI